jgi:hypothetical protein
MAAPVAPVPAVHDNETEREPSDVTAFVQFVGWEDSISDDRPRDIIAAATTQHPQNPVETAIAAAVTKFVTDATNIVHTNAFEKYDDVGLSVRFLLLLLLLLFLFLFFIFFFGDLLLATHKNNSNNCNATQKKLKKKKKTR